MTGPRTRIALCALVILGMLAAVFHVAEDRVRPPEAATTGQLAVADPGEPSAASADEEAIHATAAGPAAGPMTRPEGEAPSVPESHGRVQETPAPRWTPRQAREAMQEHARYEACRQTDSKLVAFRLDWMGKQDWRWLPEDWVAREREGYLQTVARVTEDCAVNPPAALDPKDHQAMIRQAADAGDPEAAILVAARERSPTFESLIAIEQHMLDILRSGDPERIAQLQHWEMVRLGQINRAGYSGEAVFRFGENEAWRLVACDLGLSCTAGSPALDRLCLSGEAAACGASSVEDYYRMIHAPGAFEVIGSTRRQLVEAIREGRLDEIFEPLPPPPPGDG